MWLSTATTGARAQLDVGWLVTCVAPGKWARGGRRCFGGHVLVASPAQGLFNFKPSVRPVPLECHIQVRCAGPAVLRPVPQHLHVTAVDPLCSTCNIHDIHSLGWLDSTHVQGYPGKFYCPRMATMNKPAYAAIQTHSPIKPVRNATPRIAVALDGFTIL